MKKKIPKIFLIFLIFLSLITIYDYMIKIRLTNSNEEFIKLLLKDPKYYKLYKKDYNNISNKIIRYIINFDKNNPIKIVENKLNYKKEKTKLVINNDSDNNKEENKSKYVNDPKKNEITNPLVYIYNTHQLESYNKKVLEDYNITPNVMMASYILRENLNNKNINTLVETANINDFLNLNNWDYSNSYKASRYYIKDALKKYKNLKLIIDIHRDSVKKNISTTKINNKMYAKVLFVVGLEHKNYNKNLEKVNKLNKIINKKYPNLSRGIMKKEGKGVNGIYNQDLNENIILIEIGGVENNIEEIMNTSIAISDVISDYLEDNNG